MRNKDKVCNHLQASKLKRLGVNQQSSIYWEMGEDVEEPYLITSNSDIVLEENYNRYNSSAFDLSEIGQMLPPGSQYRKCDVVWDCELIDGDWKKRTSPIFSADTQVQSAAELLIFLIESNTIDVSECNERQLLF